MAFLLRKINKKTIWDHKDDTHELAADALLDLQTHDNSLSVYKVNHDDDSLTRVITALAATRDAANRFNFILLPISLVEQLGITMAATDGMTPDDYVNSTLHLDLINLTVKQIAALALAMHEHGNLEKRTKSEIKTSIGDALNNGYFRRDQLKPILAAKFPPDNSRNPG